MTSSSPSPFLHTPNLLPQLPSTTTKPATRGIHLTMNPQDPKPSFFMFLPTELHLLILNLLLFPDLIHLKLTCTYFHTLIPPLSHSALIDAENTNLAVFKDVWACRYCLRLRPRSEFADRMLHRRRGRYGRDAHNRFCVDCGLQPRVGRPRYCPGAQIVVQGISYVICLTCRDFRLGVRDSVGKSVKAECRDCLKKREVMEKDRREMIKWERDLKSSLVVPRKVWW